MTRKEVAHLQATMDMLRSRLSVIQTAEDSFYRLAHTRGWLDDADLKHALWSHQHRVSSEIHNAKALVGKALPSRT